MTLNFEDLTIKQVREITESYEKNIEIIHKQEDELRLLKIKYPNRAAKLNSDLNAEELVEEIKNV